MDKPDHITFTGFDDRTSIAEMAEVSSIYPVEWGVLISPTNRDARFPSIQAIKELEKTKTLKLSLHCCGGFSKNFQKGIIDGLMFDISRFSRVQVNGRIYFPNLLKSTAEKFGVDLIVQTNTKFRYLGHHIYQLYDVSGGRGIIPDSIPEHPGWLVGYSGGIGPDTVIEYIKRIKGNGNYWIDMETKVRTDGWFDMDKVRDVCVKVYG